MLVLSDCHLGCSRSAGTTPASAFALRQYGLQMFAGLLKEIKTDLVILGDLFDTYDIPLSDLVQTYQLLVQWLAANPGVELYLVPGNHDLSKDDSKLGSFQFLGKLMEDMPGVTYVKGGMQITDDVYVISHVPNQDLMDMELAKVPKIKYLLVHCNYDNHFAAQSDHSLNISEDQAKKLPVEFIVFAHEHHARVELSGKVFVCGNQWPTSVSDCLGPPKKFMTRLADKPERIETWDRESFYKEVDWQTKELPSAHFIRVTGTVDAGQMADVADAVAVMRKSSNAFVVSNAVKVTNENNQGQIETQSLEAARSFDVWAALKQFLSKEQFAIVEKLKNG